MLAAVAINKPHTRQLREEKKSEDNTPILITISEGHTFIVHPSLCSHISLLCYTVLSLMMCDDQLSSGFPVSQL